MATQETVAANKIFVFWLDSSHPPQAVTWLAKLKEKLGEKWQLADGHKAENAPWVGCPFILIGKITAALQYWRGLAPAARRVLDDCAYFWFLTNDVADENALWLEHQGRRAVTLSWHTHYQNIIVTQLERRAQHAGLVGLSYGLGRVRAEIERVARGALGPGSPLLMLGPSGAGKEMVAAALFAAAGYSDAQVGRVACGSFTETLLQSQLFGHEKGAFTGAFKRKKGHLELHKAVFLDDFDAAPFDVQGALLRLMATPKSNRTAEFHRLGGEDESPVSTEAWLVCATNADVAKLLGEHKWREDFIFRFEERVLCVPSLNERPADVPALAHLFWGRQWSRGDKLYRPLPSLAVQGLCASEANWDVGNVRALRALVSLAASMLKQSSHNLHSLRRLFQEILWRGPDYYHWVGIVATPAFSGHITALELDATESEVQRILALDEGSDCSGGSGKPAWPATGSEQEACRQLSAAGQAKFAGLLHKQPATKVSNKVRVSVRLARALCYTARQHIDKHAYAPLSGLSPTSEQIAQDLKLLAEYGFLTADKRNAGAVRVTVYQPSKGELWSE